MNASAFAAGLVQSLRHGAEPVVVALESVDGLTSFLQQYGWDATIVAADMAAIETALDVTALYDSLATLGNDLEAGAGDEATLISDLADVVVQIATKVEAWGTISGVGLPFPFNDAEFWATFPREVIDRLTIDEFEEGLPLFGAMMRAAGIFDLRTVTPTTPGRTEYVRYTANWDQLGRLLTDPLGLVQDSYKWTPGGAFDYERFLWVLTYLFHRARIPARGEPPSTTLLDRYFSATNPARDTVRALQVPVVFSFGTPIEDYIELGVQFLPIPPAASPGSAPEGFALVPFARGGASASAPLAELSGITLEASGGFDTDDAFVAEVRPDGVTLTSGSATISATLALSGSPSEPYILIGSDGSHRVELDSFRVALEVKGSPSDLEVIASMGTGTAAGKLRFILQASDGDSFLTSLIGTDPVELALDGTLTWSSKSGFGINGNIGFTIAIPLHLEVGPVTVDTLKLSAEAGTGSEAKFGVGVSLGAQLGPVDCFIDGIGARLVLTPGTPGVFGGLDWDWEFQPPSGVGLSITGGGFTGGGFLILDEAAHRYSGGIELSFQESLSLTAIGILDTPAGSGSYSLVIVISAEFTPIQLGFGFTLNGVGGLLGINRSVCLDVLRDGVRTGALSSILFPTDIVANASRIISDLGQIMPVAAGQFVFGPMAKIGWGTPTLITLDLGIIIELPDPVRLAILGVLKATLPTEDAAVLKLQVNFLGAIDFEAKTLSFDASLYDSKILTFTLAGDMIIRLAWGDNPGFLLSVGGFNPSFTPPPMDVPDMARLSITLLDTDEATLRVQSYFAVTSNTVQLGARATLHADLGPFDAEGDIGFDALFVVSPFHVEIGIGAAVSVRWHGHTLCAISLDGTLSGPTPWHITGRASFTVVFVSVSGSFSVTWGDDTTTERPDVAVLPLLVTALEASSSWGSSLPAGAVQPVSTATITAGEGEVVVHPVGTLRVSQKVVPLAFTIDSFGNADPADATEFDIASVTCGSVDMTQTETREYFARAQFEEMSDSEKLSSPSFEQFRSGVELSDPAGDYASSRVVYRDVEYETITVDTLYRRYASPLRFALSNAFFEQLVVGAAIARSPRSPSMKPGFAATDIAVALNDEAFVVARTSDLGLADEYAVHGTHAEASAYLRSLVDADPSLEGTLQVVPSYELNAVA